MPRAKNPHTRTSAERNRQWRLRQRDLFTAALETGGDFAPKKTSGPSGKSGKSTSRGETNRHVKRATAFDTGQFVAVDGEGFSEGPEIRTQVGIDRTLYTGREHFYALLSASDGSELYSAQRLRAWECLDFLVSIKNRNPSAILVCFAGGYDVTQILAHDLSPQALRVLLQEKDDGGKTRQSRYLDIDGPEFQYRLEYRQRKSLSIKRWPLGKPKYEDTPRGRKLAPCESCVLWDVWGFFQDSFVGVMQKWVPTHPDFQFIQTMKAGRAEFDRSDIEVIRSYNAAELRCLVAIMDKLRAAVKALGLTLKRWDGAGAIAAAMNALHGSKEHMGKAPPEVFAAARGAYSGGHIEACQLGVHDGPVYHYDINSAYPSVYLQLPSLANGRWVWTKGNYEPRPGFALVKLKFEFNPGCSFYPLFWRGPDGGILYPRRGVGWYWLPEYEVAKYFAAQFGAKVFEIVESWRFDEAIEGHRPFSWVRDYYVRRQELVKEAKRTGLDTGEEKIIKLGLNSLYGKTAQQVGARMNSDGEFQTPSYFQLEWAGYVTSGCRAQLMQAAIQNMPAIISFATDGIFSTQPLDLWCPEEKIIGAWEAKIHTGMTIVMPGVYWLHDGEKLDHYSRGFDKQAMKDTSFVIEGWKRAMPRLPVTITRLIGLGSASVNKSLWKLRGMFVTTSHELALDGDNSKRYPINLRLKKPHKGLVFAQPREQGFASDLPLDALVSAPYPVAWIDDGAKFEQSDTEFEFEAECEDFSNA